MASADTKKTPLQLAFLGCGFAARIHSKTLRNARNRVQCHYASRDSARASEMCNALNGAGSFGSYESALDSNDVDMVFVATPPSSHLEWTLRALEAGKHVMVEKPAFLRSEDVAEVKQACAKAQRRVFVAENYFYKPLTSRLRQLIEADTVGDVLFVQVNATKRQEATGWRNDPELAGGGALFEGGIHWVNLMASIGLPVTSAQGLRPMPVAGALERSMLVTLRYSGGAVGTLSYSWEVPSLVNGIRLSKISGREGSITFESNGLFVFANGKKRRIYFPAVSDLSGYKAMFSDFLSAWEEDREPEMTLDRAHQDLLLVEQAYRAADAAERD